MTQDVTAGIGIQIDSRSALDQLRQLQAGISQFNQSVVSTNAAAVARQRDLISSFAHQVEATKQFSTGITTVESSVHRLGKSIDTGKLKLGDYFSYGLAASGKFNKAFSKQHAEIMQVATDRVKRLQTQYVALGESSNGMTKALAVRPLNLFNAQSAIATQRMQLFNKLMTDGTTSLINWGKNTQWAGRQLMVGFSVPLTIFGAMAAKTFTDIEKAMVSFKRVYGDTMTTDAETNKALENVKALANEYTKYGIAVSDTIGLASKAAALGAEGPDLLAQTEQATRLATLGQIDYQQALDTTISLQTAFGISAKDLGSNIDFLNAVENQTVLSINDITESIPKVAPVIQALGGNVKDLAYMLTAMREGGVNAAEGSNALKSGLMSLINPTQAAIDKAKELGIDLQGLVQANSGDLPGMIKAVGDAFNSIDDGLAKQQLMGKVFGKYQVARMTAMFENISKEGGQASRVLDLMGRSTQNLATLSEKELSKVENAVSTKWAGSLERLKAEIAPIGELFLKMATPIVDAVTGMVKWFNDLNPVVKNVGVVLSGAFLVALPVVTMLVGLFANMFGNILKGIIFFKNLGSGFRKAAQEAGYLATAQIDTIAAAASLETAEAKLEGRTSSLTSQLNVQRSAMKKLTAAYLEMTSAAMAAVSANPKGFRISKIKGYAKGRVQVVPGSGSGKKDTELAMLAPGEAVINAEDSKRYAPLLAAINSGKLPGYARGRTPRATATSSVGGESFEWIPRNIKGGDTSKTRMDKLLAEVDTSASQFSKAILQMFKDLTGKAVSVNDIAGRMVKSGIEELRTIGGKYVTRPGHRPPEGFRTRKNKILTENPEMRDYYTGQYNYVVNEAEAWSRRTGHSLPDKGLPINDYGTHLSHLANSRTPDGEKIWAPNNIAMDSGFINGYINDIKGGSVEMLKGMVRLETGKGRKVSERMREAIDLYLRSFGEDVQSAKAELARLAQGLHPVTEKAVKAVAAIATTDLALAEKANYKGKTVLGTDAETAWRPKTALLASQYSLDNQGSEHVSKSIGMFDGVKPIATRSGGGYRTMGDKEIANANSALGRMVKRIKAFATKFSLGMIKSTDAIDKAVTVAGAALEIKSPSKKLKKLGKGVEDGAIQAAEHVSKAEKMLRKQLARLATVDETAAVAVATPVAKKSRLRRLNPLSSFGAGATVDSALFALSMVPGVVGEFSQNLMFATMGLQALTGVASAIQGTKIAGMFAPLAQSGILASGALGAIVSTGGLAIAGLAALGGVAWLVYNQYQEQQKYIHGLGEAARVTADQVSNLGTSFGFTPRTSGLDVVTSATGNEERQQAVTAKDYVASDDAMKQKVEALRAASVQEAQLAMTSIYTGLLAQGVPGDLADKIIEQVAIAAGKETVYIDVKGKLSGFVDKNGKPDFEAASTEIGTAVSGLLGSANTKQLQEKNSLQKQVNDAMAEGARLSNEMAAAEARYTAKSNEENASTEEINQAMRDANKARGDWEAQMDKLSGLQAKLSDATRDSASMQDTYTRELEASTAATRNYVDLASAAYGDGTITYEEYMEAIMGLQNQFAQTPDGGLDVFKGILGQRIDADTTLAQYKDTILENVTDIDTALQLIGAFATGNTDGIEAIKRAMVDIATNTDPNPTEANVARIRAALALIPGLVAQSSNVPNTDALDAKIAATKEQIAALKSSNKKSGGSSGGGGSKPSKYDKKSDAIAKANARLDLAEVKIDKTEDAKIQAAMDKRWGGKTIEIDGLSVTVENSADIDYAMQQISERIDDINRDEIDPLNEKLDKLNDTQDAINRKTAEYQQEIDKINESYDAQTKPLERANDLLTFQKETIEAQRDKQLEGIDLQTTALQNQIDTAEYAAQVQGQLIDDQIEKNNLNAELIQKQVDAIDDQVSALEDVKKINEILSAQKQSQLSLASALSSGDAGAAASAMLNAQSTAASGASELQSAGLQAQRDELQTQVNAISEQNDLLSKRKDAIDKGVDALNRQLSALNQQRTVIENNYKLEIQGIENSIAANSERLRQLEYERTTRTAYWQDQIDRYAPALRDLNNQIYVIEQQIKKIQDEKIKPLERQRDLLDDIVGDVKDQISREKAVIDQKRKQLDYANKINSAMKTLYDRSKNAANGVGGIGGSISSANKEIDKLTKKLQALEGEKFRTKIEQGLVIRDQHGRIRVMDSPEDVRQAIQYAMGGTAIVTKNDITGAVKIGGKTVKGDYKTLSEKIGESLDDPVEKETITALYKDKDQYKIKIIKTEDIVALQGPGRARGGFIGGGFRGVAMGDNTLTPMRSGEGVTVAEAFRRNKYETDRLNALNKAALSGNMGGFYREWSAPELTNTVANVQPVATTSGPTIHNEYNFDITGGPNVNTDELVNKVVYKIKESQRGQIRSM